MFAAWVSNKKLEESFIDSFNKANAFGTNLIESVVKNYPDAPFDLEEYYTKYIRFKLDEDKLEGLNLFLENIAEKEVLGKIIKSYRSQV